MAAAFLPFLVQGLGHHRFIIEKNKVNVLSKLSLAATLTTELRTQCFIEESLWIRHVNISRLKETQAQQQWLKIIAHQVFIAQTLNRGHGHRQRWLSIPKNHTFFFAKKMGKIN